MGVGGPARPVHRLVARIGGVEWLPLEDSNLA